MKELSAFSHEAQSIFVNRVYEYYKGQSYKILALARHSESLEELVVYQAIHGESLVWVRSLALFLENVTINENSTEI